MFHGLFRWYNCSSGALTAELSTDISDGVYVYHKRLASLVALVFAIT